MKKSISTRVLSLLMTMAILFGTFSGLFSLTANALDLSKGYEVSWDHTLVDRNGVTFTWYGGIASSSNAFGHSYSNTSRSIHDYTVKRLGLTGSSADWEYDVDYLYAFCIEPGVPLPNYTEYRGSNNPTHGDKWERLSQNQQKMIQLVLTYGYPNRWVGTSRDANACYAATQVLVWIAALGWMNSPTDITDRSHPMPGYTGGMVEQLCNRSAHFKEFYDAILADMAKHYTIPSFARSQAGIAQTYELTQSGGQWRATLTDTNGVLSDFYVTASGGVSTSISGNTLTLTSSTPITSEVTISLTRRMPTTGFTTGWLIWSVPGKEGANQDMVTGVDSDPVPAYLKLKVSTGNLAIIKTTQHHGGTVSGFQFEVRNSSNTLIGTYTSDSSGRINIPNLVVGTYSVREVNLSSDFVAPTPNPVSVEVRPGETASVSFDNIRKRGIISIRKTDANPTLGGYSLAGAVFEVRDAGNNLVDTVTTDSNGRAQTKILPLGVYRIKELQAPYGFCLDPNTYTSTLSGIQGTDAIVYAPDVSIAETPQVGRINIEKYNADKMMGDYDLKNTVFEVRAAEDIRRADGSYYARAGDLMDTLYTDSQGKVQSKDLKLGAYTVTEKSAVYGYIHNTNSYPVKLEYGGQTVPIVYGTATVPNYPQTGRIRIHKLNASPNLGDYDLKNAVFEVRAAQDIKTRDGTVIYNKGDLADTVTTNSAGEAMTKELPLGAFTVREKTSPYGFVLNTTEYNPVLSYAGQDVSVTYTDVTVPEQPQVGTITVTKYDLTTGTRAQGDASLRGAVFNVYCAADIKKLDGSIIYAKDQLVQTLYCGNNTSATTKELPLGSFYVKESVPPQGYNLDTSRHDVTIEYQGQNVAVVRKNAEVKNKVIEGQISVVKHTDLPDPQVSPPDPQIQQPLDGIKFEIYLKSAGSYAAALPTERDLLVTNSDGYAITKKLPYGIYTVKELPDEQGRDVKLVAPFDVFISTEGRIYRYILEDPMFTSLVKIIKVDSETGKKIPAAGVSFKIKDLSTGQWVSQSYNYPVPTTIDVYETAPDGTLVMPEPLKSGTYELYEQKSPWGYVLTKEPVKFTVHSTQTDPILLEVMMANNPQKGIIKVSKVGNMLTSVQVTETSFGKQYTPIFGLTGLKGAVFEIRAAEDIYTPDGTLRYAKNTVVDTVTTDAGGYAESKQLYLGHYIVVEIKSPSEFVIDKTPHDAFLTYAGQEVAVTSTQIGIENIRQKVEIDLQKLMERPVNAPPGFDPFKDVIFGLFADQDIKAVDGSVVIPKGALVALMQVDSTGKGVISGELPFAQYYVQEVQTNIFYQLNTTKYPVSAVYAGQDVVTSKVQVHNGGIAIPNETKLGKIIINKTGEMLVGATESTNKDEILYTPIYEIRNLPGVTFNIVADEDLYDVYGRLIAKKGTVMDTVTTTADGTAASKLLPLGRYVVVETAVPYGMVLDPTLRPVTIGFDCELSDILTKRVSIHNERQKAEIVLSKNCEWPENAPKDFNPYNGVIFDLIAAEDIKAADGKVVIPAGGRLELITFDASGKAEIKTDLPFGKFYVQEYMVTYGYVFDDTRYDFSFDYDATAGKVVTINVNGGNPVVNKLQRGSLKVIKTFEGTDVPIQGVPFTITGKTLVGSEIVIHTQTDENGEIFLENLLAGEYTVTELDSDLTAGYYLSPAETIIVAHDQIAEMEIHNILQRGSLQVIKTFEGRTVPIAGVPFRITGKTVVGKDFDETFYTDEDGIITIEGLLVGDYTVQELETDLTLGYILSEEESAVVAPDQITELKIHNKLQRGDLKIIKTFESREYPIAGVPFSIEGISIAGMELSEIFHTDENGMILVEGLPIGHYTVKELDVELTAGYILSATQTAVVATDQLTTLEIGNRLQRGSLKIVKVFEGRETPIANVPFLIEGVSVAGIAFSKTLYTDADGLILVEGLPVGDYTIRELESDLTKGYHLSPEQTVTVTADKTSETVIENKLQRGSLKLIKTFEGREYPIANVPFLITGITVTGDVYSQVFYTDANGVIEISRLLIGDYLVEELKTPLTEGYILSEAQAFIIATDELTTLTIGNKLIRGNVTLTKTDADFPDRTLSGAIFEIHADTNGNGKFDKGDVLVGTMTEKDGGVHEMLGLQYGGYFVVEKQGPDGFVKDGKAYYFAIVNNGETVTVENQAGKGFVNASQKGSLRIIKSSSDGKKEGFTFRIEGDGYSETFITDKNGEIFIESLRIGTYVITEIATDATKGYLLPAPVTVEIIKDELLEVKVHNDKVTTDYPDSPKTGDTSNMTFWIILMCLSGGALLTTLFVSRKKRTATASK